MSIFLTEDNIDCVPTDIDHDWYSNCRNPPEAVDFMSQLLPDQMPLQERCKRYTLLFQFIKEKRLPSRHEVFRLSEISAEEVSKRYQEIDARDLSEFYMIAIDGYRASKLSRPVLELCECLSLIGTPYGEMYLKNPELTMTLDLYKRVLESPETKIDLGKMELRNFHPASQQRLKILFKEYLKDSDVSSDNSTELKRGRGRPVSEPPRSSGIPPARRRKVPIAGVTDEELIEQRRKRNRDLGRGRLRRFRERHPSRHREQERLRQQRLRILNPELVRNRVRRWDLRQRELRKQRLEEQRKRLRAEMEVYIKEQQQYLQIIGQQPSLISESSGPPHTAGSSSANSSTPAATMPGPTSVSEASLPLAITSAMDPHLQERVPSCWVPFGDSSDQQLEPVPALLGRTTPLLAVLSGPEQRTFYMQRPLVRPMTPFPRFSPQIDSRVAHSSPYRTYSATPAHRSEVDSYNQVTSGLVSRDADLQSSSHLYQYLVEGETNERHTASDSPTPSLHGLGPSYQGESGTFDDLLSFGRQLDDTDEVVRLIADQAPASTADTTFAMDLNPEDPWYDFDRGFSKRQQ